MARNVRFTGIPDSIAKGAEMKRAVERVADEIADNVRAQGIRVEGTPGDVELPVEVDVYETDRARASVVIAHAAGLAVQAKHGVLTKAASAAGYRVKGKR